MLVVEVKVEYRVAGVVWMDGCMFGCWGEMWIALQARYLN
jgi:hypothetical protein